MGKVFSNSNNKKMVLARVASSHLQGKLPYPPFPTRHIMVHVSTHASISYLTSSLIKVKIKYICIVYDFSNSTWHEN
jgi:hypothetical protein